MLVDYSLMFVTDDSIEDDEAFFSILESALQGGVTIVQLREKKIHTQALYYKALKTKNLCEKYNIPLIINDRVDIALAVNADGLHIGQKDIPYTIARKMLGKEKIIGLSVSNKEQAKEAQLTDVDYIGLSPIFSTTTKTLDLDKPLKIEGLKNIRNIYSDPIVSIGGINKTNVVDVIQNGSTGVAVVSAISKAEDPRNESKKLKEMIWKAGTKL